MKFNRLIYLIKSDLYRYEGALSFKLFVKIMLLERGFKLSTLYRICRYLELNDLNILSAIIFKPVFCFFRDLYNIDLFTSTNIDSGLYIGHSFGIVVNSKAVIGKNVNIGQNVTIGVINRGKYKGVPTIGDNVYIGPNACILGNIKIGNNVAIGANAVVLKNIPDNSVVVGVPAKVISDKGVEGYIDFINYDEKFGLNQKKEQKVEEI